MAGKRQQWGSRSLARKPHFFKVLLGDFAKRLKIPPNFLKNISTEASRRVTLQGPSGSKWYVQLVKNVNGTFLTAGWPKFVKDHSLKEHEFLVFQYEGNMHFNVLIFDTTACEREDVLSVRPHRSSKSCNETTNRGRPPKITLDVGCYVKNEASESELTDLRNDGHAPNQLQVHYSNSIQERCIRPPKPCGDVKIKTEDDELPICMIGSPSRQYKGFVSRRRPVTVEERAKAREAANSFTSIFPYMILRMTAMNVYRTYMLRFPAWFSRAHLPRKRTNMVLRDPSGKAWVVVYIPSSRDRLSGGWSAFARGNNLEEGDYCVFELVGPVEMRVHIFRVVEEITPLIRMPRMQEVYLSRLVFSCQLGTLTLMGCKNRSCQTNHWMHPTKVWVGPSKKYNRAEGLSIQDGILLSTWDIDIDGLQESQLSNQSLDASNKSVGGSKQEI